MSLSIQIVDPTHLPCWDSLLLRTPGASFFHGSAWARVLSESYGYTPLYFSVIENERLRALVPMMEVSSFLTGKRGVSLPFTDYCEPIIDETVELADRVDLFNQIVECARKRGWKYIELRGGNNLLPVARSRFPVSPAAGNLQPATGNFFEPPEAQRSSPPSKQFFIPNSAFRIPHSEGPTLVSFITYFGHTLDLTKGVKALHAGLRDSTRRNIKKAEKEKVEIRIEKTGEAMRDFYRLNCLTRREHGLPPQPYHFFEKVHRHIISKESGFIALAYFQGKAIAANVYFHFGDRAIYKYGASDKKFQDLRANNLVMWEAIKWFAGNGFKSFCFGRTEMENDGLRQFKNGWGPEEQSIHYFRYDLREGVFAPGKQKGEPIYTSLFRATPIPVLNVIGSLLYRHMG
jgi:hypothetical protein